MNINELWILDKGWKVKKSEQYFLLFGHLKIWVRNILQVLNKDQILCKLQKIYENVKKLQDLSKKCRWTQVCRWMQVHVHKCRCIQLCKLQTQYIFTVYCIVHKIPFWLDPNNNNISIPKTAHFVNSRSKKGKDKKVCT